MVSALLSVRRQDLVSGSGVQSSGPVKGEDKIWTLKLPA